MKEIIVTFWMLFDFLKTFSKMNMNKPILID